MKGGYRLLWPYRRLPPPPPPEVAAGDQWSGDARALLRQLEVTVGDKGLLKGCSICGVGLRLELRLWLWLWSGLGSG